MRSDMPKVLTEGARRNWGPSKKWGKRIKFIPDHDYEDVEGGKAPISRRQYGYDCKELTDLLGPLRGYLRSCVGRPWDEVYSEVAESLDFRSVSGFHILSHLWQYVDVNCWFGAKTGKVYTNGDHGVRTVYWFYVHPWTGLLCDSYNEGWVGGRYQRKRTPVTMIDIVKGETAYEWIEGIWYYTEYSMVTVYVPVVHERYKYIGNRHSEQKKEKVYQVKRQLSKKELKTLGLSNLKLKVA